MAKLKRITLSPEELATVLASLRVMQGALETGSYIAPHGSIMPVESMDHFHEHEPLSIDEIDVLCERING